MTRSQALVTEWPLYEPTKRTPELVIRQLRLRAYGDVVAPLRATVGMVTLVLRAQHSHLSFAGWNISHQTKIVVLEPLNP